MDEQGQSCYSTAVSHKASDTGFSLFDGIINCMTSLDFGIVSTVTISKLDSGHLLVFSKPKSPKI